MGQGELADIVRSLRKYVQLIDDNEWDGSEAPTVTRLNSINSSLLSAQISMLKLGVKPPLYQLPSSDPVRFIRENYKYLEPIQRLMAAGHLREARQISSIAHKASAVGTTAKQ